MFAFNVLLFCEVQSLHNKESGQILEQTQIKFNMKMPKSKIFPKRDLQIKTYLLQNWFEKFYKILQDLDELTCPNSKLIFNSQKEQSPTAV